MPNLVNKKQGRDHFGLNAVNLSWLERRAWGLRARCAALNGWKNMIDGCSRHVDGAYIWQDIWCFYWWLKLKQASPGLLDWVEVCLLIQPSRSEAEVSMPATGLAELQCSTCQQHLPECSCHQSWAATAPTEHKTMLKERKTVAVTLKYITIM